MPDIQRFKDYCATLMYFPHTGEILKATGFSPNPNSPYIKIGKHYLLKANVIAYLVTQETGYLNASLKSPDYPSNLGAHYFNANLTGHAKYALENINFRSLPADSFYRRNAAKNGLERFDLC